MDRALRYYRRCGEHALAGDLLKRVGEEELAAAEYELAAARLVEYGQGYYQAGELLLSRAGRPDLAVPYYEAGWKCRPSGAADTVARILNGTGTPFFSTPVCSSSPPSIAIATFLIGASSLAKT